MPEQRAPFVFVASPVSHPQPAMVVERTAEAARFGAWVLDIEHKNVFVAAVHDMALRPYLVRPNSEEWWETNLEVFMAPAEACYVLCLEGWESSRGVKLEMNVAKRLGKPVFYYHVTEDGYARA